MKGERADVHEIEGKQALFVVTLGAMFWFVFAYLAARPREAVTAYRG